MTPNPYLSLLKRESAQKTGARFQKHPPTVLTELTKGASVSFVSDWGTSFQKNDGPGGVDSVGRASAPFWPWAPRLTAADIGRSRAKLAALIVALAAVEHWPDDIRAGILDRAARDPLSALMPNVAYFRDRLADAQIEVLAREEAARRAWRFDDRR